MNDPKNSLSLSDFERNLEACIARLERTGEPAFLSLEGHAQLVVELARKKHVPLEQ